MDDLISRQTAIDAIAKQMPRSYTPDGSHPADEGIFMAQEIYADCIETLEILPSAQPDLTDEDRRLIKKLRTYHNGSYARVLDKLIDTASAQPEPHYDEWCYDCKEYDKEKHCCPRWNKVIRSTLQEAQPERKRGIWIPQNHNKVNGMTSTAVYYYPKCSACGHCAYPTNFCPNCGAQMEGSDV